MTSSSEPPEPGPQVGEEFAGHRIEAVIGRGGMGVVYRARNLALDRERALKVITPGLSGDGRFRERFQRESRLAASIEHPNVVAVHEAGERDGQLYLSMRLVEGMDLRRLVETGGPLDPASAIALAADVAAALEAAHDADLIHRDVKPANVLVGSGTDQGRIFLSDFGISRTARGGETVTASGEIVGSADFIAPEQIAGDPVDHRADLYALGGVLHYALTGEPPFPREQELATLFAHANASRPRPSAIRDQLPPGLDTVVARAMAIDPADRPGSARELAAELGGAPLEAARTHPLARTGDPPRSRSRLTLWLGLAIVGLLAAAVAVTLLDGEPRSESSTGPGQANGRTQPRVADSIQVLGAPTGLTVRVKEVYVAAPDTARLYTIALTNPELSEPIALPASANSVAPGFGSIWAVSDAAGALYRIDPFEGGVQAFEIGVNPSDVAVDERFVWITLEGESRVVRFDPGDATAATVTVGSGPRAVATGGGAVWVSNIEEGTVSKVDPDDLRRIGNPIEVGGRPSDVAYGLGAVWAIDNLNGTLSKIEPGATEGAAQLVERLEGLERPRGVKTGFGSVWVANAGDATLRRIDAESVEQTASVGVGSEPSDVAVGAGSVWVSNEDSGDVTRVEPRRRQRP